ASPFLTKAASMHGEMAVAPFKNRQAAAFRTLEDWVCLTVRTNPQLHGEPTAVTPPVVLPPSATPGSFGEERTGPPNPLRPDPTPAEQVNRPAPPPPPPSMEPNPQAGPATPTQPDAFDPDEFNRINRVPPPRP